MKFDDAPETEVADLRETAPPKEQSETVTERENLPQEINRASSTAISPSAGGPERGGGRRSFVPAFGRP